MAEQTYYHTAVVDGSLAMFVVQHGVFLYTAHVDEDGNKFWFYQGLKRNVVPFKTYEFDTKIEDWPTVQPAAAQAADEHGYEFKKTVKRSYESLRGISERLAAFVAAHAEDPDLIELAQKLLAEAPNHVKEDAKE